MKRNIQNGIEKGCFQIYSSVKWNNVFVMTILSATYLTFLHFKIGTFELSKDNIWKYFIWNLQDLYFKNVTSFSVNICIQTLLNSFCFYNIKNKLIV